MSEWAVERTITADTPEAILPVQVPHEIWGYAKAFLLIGRPALRFLWRSEEHWLDVQLARESTLGSPQPAPDRVNVRIEQVEMPRGITVRELDVLTLLALGLTNIGVAERLGTSARTVSSQLERLLEKLGQSTRGGLAALAVDLGLLRLPLPGGVPDGGGTGIGVAELERAVQHRLDRGYLPIREHVLTRIPIRLGIVVPNHSPSDSEQTLNGALLAVEEINQQGGIGGRQIEPITEVVSTFDWGDVRAALHRLFDADVDAIISSYVSAEHPGFMEEIAAYGKPFLHTATFEADVKRAEQAPWKYGMIFQTCASETYYGAGMLRLLDKLERAERWRPASRTVVPIEMPSESMNVASPAFREQAEAAGWRVTDAVYSPVGETDWDAVMRGIAAHDPDVILIANYIDSELIAFHEAFLRSGLRALVYGIYSPSNPSFVHELGERANGVIWSTTTGTYDDELGGRFRAQYRAKFRHDPGWSIAGAVYDQVRMLAAAWSSVDARNTTDVVRYLRRWPYRGVNGVYYFGETGQAPKLYPDTTPDAALSQAHQVYQILGGTHVLLDPQPFGDIAAFELPTWSTPGPESVK
ncbi:ABC transporter substrate-binding protein [Leucobacter chromiireducens]|uniref:ABC transporter substrate-binding protein n=1 Tax=Leucobacter chromiireducens TaxID=283877 RepID=UPI0013DDB0F9|nr:ABC transporter substrate-binding protein [Leucobacter chromiireducens]